MSQPEKPFKGYKMKRHPEPVGDPDDPIRKEIDRMREVRRDAIRKALETGERYRDPFEDRFRR